MPSTHSATSHARRLDAGLLTVIDATNVQPDSRKSPIGSRAGTRRPPRRSGPRRPGARVHRAQRGRDDRSFGAAVITRQQDQLRRSHAAPQQGGLPARSTCSPGVEAIAQASFVREPLLNDRRQERGPFDAIGDVHGCRSELETLLTSSGTSSTRDVEGRPIDAAHPEGRRAIFLGDLVDRGPDTPGVLRLAMGMVGAGMPWRCPGNHESKLVRALQGKRVQTEPRARRDRSPNWPRSRRSSVPRSSGSAATRRAPGPRRRASSSSRTPA